MFTFHVDGRESSDGGSDGPDVGQLDQVRRLLGSQREDGGPEILIKIIIDSKGVR